MSVGRDLVLSIGRLYCDIVFRGLDAMPRLGEVDLRWLERTPEAGPQPTVVMVQDGERAFLSRRAGSARPATLDVALADPAARHLHIAEFATLAEIPDLIDRAKHAGLTVSLDPSWDDDWIRRPDLIARAAGADIFLPNAAEARVITACDDLDKAGRRLAQYFPTSREQALAEGLACGTLSVRSGGGAGMRLDRADVDAMSQNLLHSDDRIDA